MLVRLLGHAGPVFAVDWISHNRLLSCSDDKTARLWEINLDDPSASSVIGVFSGHIARVWSACFVPSWNKVVTASEDWRLRVTRIRCASS